MDRTIKLVQNRHAPASAVTSGKSSASTGDDHAAKALNRLGDLLDKPKKVTRKVGSLLLRCVLALLNVYYQLVDHKCWDRLAKVDLEDVDEYTVPPLALLNFLRDYKDKNDSWVPFVELMALCIPDWST